MTGSGWVEAGAGVPPELSLPVANADAMWLARSPMLAMGSTTEVPPKLSSEAMKVDNV